MLHTQNVVISAAGLGSRLGLNIPKCLVKINGRSILRRQLELLNSFERVYVVVGFKEEEVMAEGLRYRQDLIFIRNPDFATTTNTFSLALAAKFISGTFLALDGDVILDPHNFDSFRLTDFGTQSVVCVKPVESQDCIYVQLSDDKEFVVAFSQLDKSPYEWTGVALINQISIDPGTAGFLYKVLELNLPLKSYQLKCYEIDTPQDLEGVASFLSKFEEDL